METKEKYVRVVKDAETKEYIVEVLDTSRFKDYDELDEFFYGDTPHDDFIAIEEDLDNVIAVEYDGELFYTITWSMLEEELVDEVVDVLKRDKYFEELEFAEDPEDDDIKTTIQVFEHLKSKIV